ncbi:trypsin-1-like [Bacillus rossius redtenbacheri]|uniref:trypsin-1-like n=1 Tax=Bacillus rossius redtenbacheri TaxID=93214 RepID=UPI002FDDE63F
MLLITGVFALLLASCPGNAQQIVRNNNMRIMGGSNAEIEKFPYVVSMFMEKENVTFGCGGSIISHNWVLSAAHCTIGYSVVKLHVGSINLVFAETDHLSAQIINHPDFNSIFLYNDISLIKVAPPFVYSATVQPAKLPAADAPVAVGTMVTAIGWGNTDENGTSSSVLMKVSIPVISNTECVPYVNYLMSSQMCAGYSDGGKDACQGDSGGPVVAEGVQVGIVSGGQGCGRPNSPGLYTRVSAFREWIRDNTGV